MSKTFHRGERALQRESGADARLAEFASRFIRDAMPQQHRDFFPLLPFLVLGGVDPEGQPVAGMLCAAPGFAHSPHERLLRVDALPGAGDPLAQVLAIGAPIGMLGIQPHTGRRNRLNGRVQEIGATGFSVAVEQSFGNCPKYIVRREASFDPGQARGEGTVERLDALDARARALVRQADTFFLATAHPEAALASAASTGADVSHRGGPAGFVEVDASGRVLSVPDYVGNSFFNSLGNLLLNPRCALLFVEFGSGSLLHVQGRGEVVRDAGEGGGTRRLLRVQVDAAIRRAAVLPLRWREPL